MLKVVAAVLLASLVAACGGGSDSDDFQHQYGSVRINGAPFEKDRLDACRASVDETGGAYTGEDKNIYITFDGCTDDPFQKIEVFQVTYMDPKRTPNTRINYTIAKYATTGDYQATYSDDWSNGASAPVQIDRDTRRVTFSNLSLPLSNWGGSRPKPVDMVSIDGQFRY